MTGSLAPSSVRATIHLLQPTRIGLKRHALDSNSTMSSLIRQAIGAGLEDPAALAQASFDYRRARRGVRTTLDLSREQYRSLKVLAVDYDTSVQALISAAIDQMYPELGIDGHDRSCAAASPMPT